MDSNYPKYDKYIQNNNEIKKAFFGTFFSFDELFCKFVNEILIVFQKNFRKCGKRLFYDHKNGKKPTYINETNKNFKSKVRQNSRPQKSA